MVLQKEHASSWGSNLTPSPLKGTVRKECCAFRLECCVEREFFIDNLLVHFHDID